jgi:hypothetical protein
MTVKHIVASDGTITFSISAKFEGSFLQQESQIQELVNELGQAATHYALIQSDVSHGSLSVEGVKYTLKGSQKKSIKRHMG